MAKYYYDKHRINEDYVAASRTWANYTFYADGGLRIDSRLQESGMNISLDHKCYPTELIINDYGNFFVSTGGGNGISLGSSTSWLHQHYPRKHLYFEVGYPTIVYSVYVTGEWTCTIYEWYVDKRYSQGALITADIVAENGTYPTNGRHTDGYWYVRRAVVNTVPTVPVLTVPTGQFEHGDKHMISFSSTDAENNAITYTLDALWDNNTSFTNLYKGTATAYQFTVPSDKTNVQFRVKASDGTLETTYALGTVKSIRAVMYYWSKFNTITHPSDQEGYTLDYSKSSPSSKDFASIQDYKDARSSINGAYTALSASGNSVTGFTVYGSGSFHVSSLSPGTTHTAYSAITLPNNGKLPRKWILTVSSSGSVNETDYASGDVKGTGIYGSPSYSRGSLISNNIQAGLNAYTNDRRHSDGFWYVRGQRVLDTTDTTPPVIELTEQEAYDLQSSVLVKAHDLSPISVLKYAKGDQTADYFASNGTAIVNGQSFTATENAIYTAFAQDSAGNKAIKTITTTRVNQKPTLTLKDVKDAIIINNGSRAVLRPHEDFYFKLTASDIDTSDSLTYIIKIDNIDFVASTPIQNNELIDVKVPLSKVGATSSLVSVAVSDDKGASTTSSFTIVNKIPESYSNRHIYDHILKFI